MINYAAAGGNRRAIKNRLIDAFVHTRDHSEVEAAVVTVYLPDGRCHVLLERGTIQPDDLPGTHPSVYREAAAAGVFGESMAADLTLVWT